jgi:autotransporter-associated beta strand protein
MHPFHWLRSHFARANPRCRAVKRPRDAMRCLLHLERLEDRLAPAVITYEWTGQGATNLWSDAANWTNGGPAVIANGNQGILLFHSNAPQETSVDDLANLSVGAPGQDAIRFDASAGVTATGGADLQGGYHFSALGGAVLTTNASANAIDLATGLATTETFDGPTVVLAAASTFQVADTTETLRLTANSAVNLNGNNLTVVAPNPAAGLPVAVQLDGLVSSDAGVNLTSGVLALNAANVYTGATNVNGGTLIVNGTQAQNTVNLGNGTLAGTGTVGIIATKGGTISPGVNGPGVLTANSVFLDPASTFTVQIAGTKAGSGYDQLAVGKSISLANATLSLTDNQAFPIGSTFTIVQGGNVSGTFAGLADGSIIELPDGAQFQINYTTTGVILTLLANPIVISPSTLPPGQVGVAYNQTITATNGTAPFTFTLSAGALPAGLTLAPGGVLSGTPTAAGTFNFTVRATYIDSDFGPLSQTQSYTLTINPPALVLRPTLPSGLVAVPYDQPLVASSGGLSFTFAVTTGTLPAGLSLDPNSGVLSGPFATAGGTASFTVTATATNSDTGPYSVTQTYTLVISPPNFTYDIPSKTLTITGAHFTFAQATTDRAGLKTNYSFTMDGYAETLPATTVAHVVVNNPGPNAGSATLFTNDTYAGADGLTHETREIVLLGPLDLGRASGNGLIQKVDANGNTVNFLQLYNFPTSVAFVGPADNGRLYGSSGVANTLYTVGGYSYIEAPGVLHQISGAAYVYGYAAGPNDTQLLFDGSGPTAVVISGTAFSYASGTDNGQAFFNEGVGFRINEGIAQHPGQDIAYMLDSPSNDVFVGLGTNSYMYNTDGEGNLNMLNEVFGFAMVYAQSFVGGIDFAYIYDSTHNITSGFDVLA